MLQDIAVVTGGTVVSEEVGLKLDSIELSHLGTARKVIATKDNTTIVGGKGKKPEIERRTNQIKAQIAQTESSYDKKNLEERMAKLSGGVAVLRVGAATEVEQKEKQHRIEDAVAATKAAVEEGIVPGGGVALVRASKVVENLINSFDKEQLPQIIGAKIVLQGLYAPIKQIAENAGYNGDVVLDKIMAHSDSEDYGFNAANGKYEHLLKAGIVDPTKVTRLALQNAVSIASMFLITEAVVANLPEKKEKGENAHGSMMDY